MATLILNDADIKAFLSINDSEDDLRVAQLNAAVSSSVGKFCGRTFDVSPSQSATTRRFRSLSETVCEIHDCWSITLVETDTGDDGTFATDWSSSDWDAHPLDGIAADGTSGWPYTKIVAVSGKWFPVTYRPNVRVTAKWGWSELPGDVTEAALQLCGELFRSRNGGFDTFTTEQGFTTIRQNRVLRDLLQPYRRATASDGRFRIGG